MAIATELYFAFLVCCLGVFFYGVVLFTKSERAANRFADVGLRVFAAYLFFKLGSWFGW